VDQSLVPLEMDRRGECVQKQAPSTTGDDQRGRSGRNPGEAAAGAAGRRRPTSLQHHVRPWRHGVTPLVCGGRDRQGSRATATPRHFSPPSTAVPRSIRGGVAEASSDLPRRSYLCRHTCIVFRFCNSVSWMPCEQEAAAID
jgi:hypothetical protein